MRSEREPGGDRRRRLAGDSWFPQLLLIATLMLTTINAVRPMASYRALSLGATPLEIGLLPAAFAVLSLVVAVPAGRWIDRIGEAPFLLLGTVLMVVSLAAMIWVDTVLLLIATQAVLGLGHIINIIAAQTMIANRTSRDGRDARYGYYSVAASLGQLIGPVAAGVIAGTVAAQRGDTVGESTTLVFVAATMVSIPALLLSVNLLRDQPRRGPGATGPTQHGYLRSASEILRMPTMLPAIAVSIGVILSIDLLVAYLPVYGEERGLPVELVGALLSVRAASSMASRLAMPRLISMVGRARLLWGSAALAGVTLALVPFTDTPALLVGLMVLTGLGLGFGQPMTIAWVASRAPHSLRATALGVRLTGNRIGQLVIPAGVGLAAGVLGIAAVFWSMAIVLLASAAVVRRTPFEASSPSPEAPSHAAERTGDDGRG
ncbi:MAG TPA: MFS transporter [Candidatus Limnocylindria bacterium]|nr:MFS transporter [Candidatus Limnocylindria bacterium]